MIRAGFTIINPQTHSRTVVLESDAETNGRGWLLEVHTAPAMRSDIAEHLHLTWTETFEILSGTAFYSLDGVQKTAQAGETFVVKPGQRHIHPWNAGETEMVYRQRNDFGKVDPRTVQGSIFGFPTRFTSDGTWSFMNDDEDVKIVIGNETTTYNIQRLASKELWLRKTVDTSTYTYYFEGL